MIENDAKSAPTEVNGDGGVAVDINEERKKVAVAIVDRWAEMEMSLYKEGTRKGKRLKRGEKIDFSREKMKSALLMVMHPTVSLAEISEICGVSREMLSLWRTQPDYKKEIESRCEQVARYLSGLIETCVERVPRASPLADADAVADDHFRVGTQKGEEFYYLAYIVSVLNERVKKAVSDWLGERIRNCADRKKREVYMAFTFIISH